MASPEALPQLLTIDPLAERLGVSTFAGSSPSDGCPT
jgi:hypothetical protein